MGLGQASQYEITHIKKGAFLNVRDIPFLRNSKIIGKLAFNVTNITIRECSELLNGSEWCYINAPRGASHIEGWVSSHYLKKLPEELFSSKAYIQNFLQNFYMAEEENFLDKLKVFYAFPMQQYLWYKNLSLLELRSQKVGEYKLWPKRKLHLTYVKILKRKELYIDVQATVRWRFSGYGEYEMGKDVQKLRLIPLDNTFKVLALKTLSHTVFPKPVIEVEENTTISTEEIPLVENERNSSTDSKFYIKTGSFFSPISPSYLAKISQNGFPYFIQKSTQGNRVVRRLFIGPFDSMSQAETQLVKVRAKINKYAYIQSRIR